MWAAGSATNVKVGSSTGAPCNGSNDALIFTLGGGTEVPVGAIGGLGLAVVAGGGLAAFTVYSRRRRYLRGLTGHRSGPVRAGPVQAGSTSSSRRRPASGTIPRWAATPSGPP